MATAAQPHEEAVGILSFANDVPGFSGILKQRYTDFKVNEVDLQGRKVQLTSLRYESATDENEAPQVADAQAGAPAEAGGTQQNSALPAEELEGAASTPKAQLDDEAATEHANGAGDVSQDPPGSGSELGAEVEAALLEFKSVGYESDVEQLRSFLLAVQRREKNGPSEEDPEPLFLHPEDDKARRTVVHNFFKRPAFSSLLTETITPKQSEDAAEGAAPSIRVTYLPPKRRKTGGRGRGRWPEEWPGGPDKFLQFVLYKENMDTQAALSLLGRYLRVHWSAFAVAGSKDKRGATVQHATLHKVHPKRLAGLNPKLRGVQTGNYCFVPDGLHLGSLSGNVFDIVLRNVKGSPASVALAADALRKSGFINYFGLQRFGNAAAPTHEIGRQLLRGEWQAAVRLIMQPRSGEKEPAPEARRLFLEARDISASSKLMPPYLTAEKAILKALLQRGQQDYVGALLQIPRNLRTMYLHAVQSYLWNLAASHRVATHGITDVQLGDLVLPPTDHIQLPDESGEFVDEPASAARLAEVHTVTEEDLAAGRYSIEDVVLPIPGAQVIYPANSTAEVYWKEAERLGVELDSCSHRVKEFAFTSLPGDYRRLMHRPKDLHWQLLAYSDPNQDLGYTELAALRKEPPPAADTLAADAEVPPGKLVALQMQFQLPPSCYATMLLRELLKETTATTEHRDRTLTDIGPAAAEAEAGATQAVA